MEDHYGRGDTGVEFTRQVVHSSERSQGQRFTGGRGSQVQFTMVKLTRTVFRAVGVHRTEVYRGEGSRGWGLHKQGYTGARFAGERTHRGQGLDGG